MALASPLGVLDLVIGVKPCEGARCVPFTCDFSAAAQYDFDLTQQQQNGQFSALQTIYVDNAASLVTTIITIGATGQIINVPAKGAGYFTVLGANPPKLSIANSGGAAKVYVGLLNFYVPPTVWNVP